MEKPRIKRGMVMQRHYPQTFEKGWICASLLWCGFGMTPQAAYSDWQQVRLASASIEWMGKLGYGHASPMYGGNPNAN